jgi:hypothetical protein
MRPAGTGKFKMTRDFIAIEGSEGWGRGSYIRGQFQEAERFLSSQADTFAGANVKGKASACSVRNDSGDRSRRKWADGVDRGGTG